MGRAIGHAPAMQGPQSSQQQQAPTGRFHVLDSLRGVCACIVVLLHAHTSGWISRSALVQNGSLFVDFFFVLSGFVIAASYGDKLSQGFSIAKFMGLRLGRIYPLHFAVLMVFVAFECVYAAGLLGAGDRHAFSYPNDPFSLGTNLALVQTFVGPDGLSWNGPSWSIAVEMWTYLIFALGYRFAPRGIVPISLVLAVACCVALYFGSDRYLAVFHDGALLRCLYGFAIGTVAFRFHGRRAMRAPLSGSVATLIEIVAVVSLVMLIVLAGAGPLSLVVPPLLFVVVTIFAQEAGAISRLLTGRPFLLVGALSYSIYMIHQFLIYRVLNLLAIVEQLSHHRLVLLSHGAATRIGGSALFGDAMSIVLLALTILIAAMTYRCIELPCQRLSRKLVLGSHVRRPTLVAEKEAPTF